LVAVSYVPEPGRVEVEGQWRQEEIREAAARREMASEAKRDRNDGDSKRKSLLSRVRERLRASDR
jgi:hypothetical protein